MVQIPLFSINGRFLLQPITGVQRVARELLMAFDEMALAGEIAAPRLIVPARGELVMPPSMKAIKIERAGRFSGHLWEQLELPRLVGPETLLCLGNTAPLPRLWARGKPIVAMVHDLSYKYFPQAYSWKFKAFYGALIPQVLRYSDRIVTVSQAEKNAISAHYPNLAKSGRLSFLPNGSLPDAVAKNTLDAGVTPMGKRGYGLYVGSLTRRKNAEGLLRAAVRFLRQWPEMRFVVIGANSASFEGVSLDVPDSVAERMEFGGQVNDTGAIYEAYRHARFLLFPSYYESSGLPVTEAAMFGCPVIASDIPALRERCGEAAAYCDPGDPDSIDTAIDSVMTDPATWQALSDAGRARAAVFSWKAQAQGLIALCEELG